MTSEADQSTGSSHSASRRVALDRFYAPTLTDGTVDLRDEEFHHLAHVLRKRAGELVEIFDGRGGAARCRIAEVGKREAILHLEEPPRTVSDHGITVSVASAVPKGDRAKWLVEKLTELGVASWAPLMTGRSVVEPQGTKLDRLRQTVIAACKQCGRNHLMELCDPLSWGEWLEAARDVGHILVADPAGEQINDVLERLTITETAALRIAVGPEGGFTADELDSARAAGAIRISLGASILRVETAAIAAAAVLQLRLGSGRLDAFR